MTAPSQPDAREEEADLRNVHAMQWRERLITYLVDKMQPDHRETVVEMVMAGMRQSFLEGQDDTATCLEIIAEKTGNSGVRVAAKSARELYELNKKHL